MPVAEPAAFRVIGVVEGFYGRVWSEAEREAFLAGLAPFGLNTYLYAPKHEPALGAALLEPLDKGASQRLHGLHHACEAQGIRLWAGLHLEPPFDPALAAHRAALARKALQLGRLGVTGFAVLFDDLPVAAAAAAPGTGDPVRGSLAAAQAHAFRALQRSVGGRVPGLQWAVCPGRYTLDPALERQVGAFEPGYLARLHAALPADVPWLWTGPQVVPATVTGADAQAYLAAAGIAPGARPLWLWDNYPVNDGVLRGKLRLAPLAGRAADLPAHVQGYLFNPLLQPHLGVLPGATCLAYANDPAGYRPAPAWQAALHETLPPALHEAITELAALTSPAEATGGAGGASGLAVGGVTGNLPARLAHAWDSLARGEPIEPYLVIDFRRVMTQLQQQLPAPLREEAMPWMGRLWRALRLVETSAAGAPQEVLAPLRAEFAEWREEAPRPEVLGPWFP